MSQETVLVRGVLSRSLGVDPDHPAGRMTWERHRLSLTPSRVQVERVKFQCG